MVNRVAGPNSEIGATGLRPTQSKPKAGTPGCFSVAADSRATAVRESPPAQSVTLSAMLALQEAETEAIQDKTARRHGFALLQALSSLQKALLSPLGEAESEITSLTELAAGSPETADPGLAAVLDSIRLRAKIELLRRGAQIA